MGRVSVNRGGSNYITMARYLSSRSKQSRRAGEKLFDAPKFSLTKRNYPPGVHGPKGQPRHSDYGLQLREKQKTKHIYRLLERQFHGYYSAASRLEGNTGENLVRLLETRLDNVVYRLGFAPSRDAARQLVRHRHIVVNGHTQSLPSYHVKAGDSIAVHQSSRRLPPLLDLPKTLTSHTPVDWLSLDPASLTGTVKRLPTAEDLALGIQTQLIVEFYSR